MLYLNGQLAILGRSTDHPSWAPRLVFSSILYLHSNREHVHVEPSYLNKKHIHGLLVSFHMWHFCDVFDYSKRWQNDHQQPFTLRYLPSFWSAVAPCADDSMMLNSPSHLLLSFSCLKSLTLELKSKTLSLGLNSFIFTRLSCHLLVLSLYRIITVSFFKVLLRQMQQHNF